MLLLSSIHAQDSATRARLDTLSRKLDTISRRQQAIDIRVIQIDSATRHDIDSTFSRSLAEAKAHPEKLYNAHHSLLLSVISYIVLALFLFLAFYYLFTSALCRDDSYDPDCTLKDVRRRPFSYARVQLFWWTVIILFCYIWFYAQYNVLLPLNPTAVLLLGSGLAIFIFSKTMDNEQIRKNNVGEPTRHQDIFDSQGFLTDILSDDNGISIHRLQAVAFNVIYGIGFIGFFFTSTSQHQYPFIDFEPWQLSLLGISAIGYLGVKSSENSRATIGDRKAMRDSAQRKPEP